MSRLFLAFAIAVVVPGIICIGTAPTAHADEDGGARPLPPLATRTDIVDHYHGIAVSDPYRWLEDSSAPEVRAWAETENRVTRAPLDGLPEWKPIAERLNRWAKAQKSRVYTNFRHVAGRSFVLYRDPAVHQVSVLAVIAGLDPSHLRVVIDPRRIAAGGAIDWYVPSPDGRLVAVSISGNGTEAGSLHVFDVATGRQIGKAIPRVQLPTGGGDLAWQENSRGFWYTRYAEDSPFFMRVYHHDFGSTPDKDRYVLGAEFPRIAEVQLDNADGKGPLLVSVANGDGGESEHFLVPHDGEPIRLTKWEDRIGAVVPAADGSVLLLSYKDDPRGRLLVLTAGRSSLAQAQVLVPEGQMAFRPQSEHAPHPLTVTRKRIYAEMVDGGPITVGVFDRAGQFLTKLPGPEVATVGRVEPMGKGKVVYGVETYLEPFRYMRFDEARGRAEATKLVQSRRVDFSDAQVTREFAVADDGVRIPVTIISRKGTKPEGTTPLLLSGYGGYGTIIGPVTLTPPIRLWLDAGGVYALASLRGGGEYGPDWHRAGNLTHKQRVFDDFVAVAHHLLDRGWSAPNRLASRGGSNGGLLMGAMLVQHPDLAQAVVSEVGFYDMLREELFPNGEFNTTEFGTISDPEQFRALYATSPYYHIEPGRHYPATLMTADDDDGRVNPMQSRKMVAALQWAQAGSAPILLRTSSGNGHGIGMAVNDEVALKADVYAFLFHQLGMTVPPERALNQR
jgi:prolyl oligopeptidase